MVAPPFLACGFQLPFVAPPKTREKKGSRRGTGRGGEAAQCPHSCTPQGRAMAMRMVAAVVAVAAVMGVLSPRAAAQTPNTPDCAAKLVPCAPYMNGTGTPPDTCCTPLKDAVQNDLKCLCDIYAEPAIFQAFNISLTEALGLSKRCGLSDTTTACKGLSPSQSPPGSPSAGYNNAVHGALSFGFPGLMGLFLALWSV